MQGVVYPWPASHLYVQWINIYKCTVEPMSDCRAFLSSRVCQHSSTPADSGGSWSCLHSELHTNAANPPVDTVSIEVDMPDQCCGST